MSEYEFTPEQEKSFEELVTWLNRFSILFAVAGALILVVALLMLQGSDGSAALPGFGIGAAMIGIGVVFRRPIDNLRNILGTEGRDITELMVAIKDFSQAFLAGAVVAGLFVLMVVARLLFLLTA